ncbi:MAG: hypothetical protein M3327_07245 [Actinomycetota bacterium]|nr:hypothetical protein [Actinomycetota bacterium]
MLEAARVQWDEGMRRVEAERGDVARYRQLSALVDAVGDELRRRVGQTFTLSELATAYTGADDWARETVLAATPSRAARVGGADAALVLDAAFGQYARGASDYHP